MASEDTPGTPTIESPLSPAILRGLGDRSYDKRKNAALEVTAIVKTLQDSGEKDRVSNVVIILSQEFIRSRNANHRKGGLIGIAASAIGLIPEIDQYLHLLIPPVLECFDDPESRVCYYACESMYNIAKIAREHTLKYFNQIFDGLCKLFAHVDVDVKNGANLLDRLIKDIVTETEKFEIATFIPLLSKHIKRTKPYIRQLLVGWITVLDAVPDIDMIDYFPDFLDGLFNMLSDPNREIRQAADNVLSEFLREIKVKEVLEFDSTIAILVSQSQSKERFNRLTALVWLSELISLGGPKLLAQYASILGSVMSCIADAETEIRNAANDTNQRLLSLVRSTIEGFDLTPLVKSLILEIRSPHVTARLASQQWVYMLHERFPAAINVTVEDLLPALLQSLTDSEDEVVLGTLQVIARISLDPQLFQMVLASLVDLLHKNRALLETRSAFIVRKLSSLLHCTKIYLQLARILETHADLEFVSLMVQTLNLILLTAPELLALRQVLKQCFSSQTQTAPPLSIDSGSEDNDATSVDGAACFNALFRCWSHSPVSTFSLCLLSQCYDLSARLIEEFAEVDVSVGLLMQLDKLVQLLESPIFVHLRLQLLREDTNDGLLRSLYGLLMLLPQSQAYHTLSNRLATVSSLQLHYANSARIDRSKAPVAALNYSALLSTFSATQARHVDYRLKLLQQRHLESRYSATAALPLPPQQLAGPVSDPSGQSTPSSPHE